LLARILQHGHGTTAWERGSREGGSYIRVVGPHNQIASNRRPGDEGDGRGRHRQQETGPVRGASLSGTPPPVL
jgi:hypothetical protein